MHIHTHMHTSIQSDTAALLVPELDFAMESGTLGGRFTTVEGVLDLAWNQLRKSNPFAVGDSTQDTKMKDFLCRLKEVRVSPELILAICCCWIKVVCEN